MLRRFLQVVALTALFAWLFGLRDGGYSGDFTFRLQTEAFLRGALALAPVPHGQRYDWAWGHGSQQVWGLGMPLLRLPFDAVAKLFGAFGFPDALVFVLFFAGVAYLFAQRRKPWEEAAILGVTVFSPAFINLCRTRFECYEEAIGGAFLMALLLGGLLLRFVTTPRPRLLLVIGALGGLAPLLRPTALFYGVGALAVASWYGRRLPRRALFFAALLFSVGIAANLALNQARFGAPFEFGQRVNVSYNPLDQFGKDFGHPYAHEPLGRAAAELFSALFLSHTANGYDFYRPEVLPLQSPTLRFRELYFATFSPWMAAALLLGWLVVWIFRKRLDAGVQAAALFSLLAFAGEAAFYLRFFAFTSRYAVDFAAAIAFGHLALLLTAFSLWRRTWPLSLAAVALVGWSIAFAWFGEVQSHRVLYSAAEARDKMPHPRFSGPTVPDHYRCGLSQEMQTGIPLNGLRWSTNGNCLVQVVTQLFLPTRDCYSLRLAPLAGETQIPSERTRQIRMKRGLAELVKIRDAPVDGDRLLTFCAPPGAARNPTGIEVVFIGWSDVANLPGPSHRLLEVAAQ